jgi:uncharacterized protein (UPF0218 family)
MLISIGIILFTTIECKDSTKNTDYQTTETKLKGTYTVVNDSAKVSFTAYKTTERAVRGVFKR